MKFGGWVALRDRLVHPGLRPGRALGLGRRLDRRATLHALDFAGGTAVHINAGAAALGRGPGARQAGRLAAGEHAAAQRAVRRPRRRPAVVRLVRLQRRLRADRRRHHRLRLRQHPARHGRRARRLVLVEWLRDGKPTLVGASSGAVAGLVAITPACGFIAPLPAILLGLVAGAVCALAVGLKYRLGYDDSLDVVGVHFVGGWIGSLCIGFFATAQVNAGSPTDPRRQGRPVLRRRPRPAWPAVRGQRARSRVYSFGVAAILALILKAAKVPAGQRGRRGRRHRHRRPRRDRVRPHTLRRVRWRRVRHGRHRPRAVDADGKADVSQKVAG